MDSGDAEFVRAVGLPSPSSGALSGRPGSLVGGEQPKFAVESEGRHVLVKFAGGDGAAADRGRDLLVCEHIALETLRGAGFSVADSDCFDLEGIRFLELERFDRIGSRGGRGVISLHAINGHFLGENPDTWSRAAGRILKEPALQLTVEDADRIVWLDTFGDLIGNTDRHFGNLSFFAEEGEEMTLSLAPVYDMLPMFLAPTGSNLVERPFVPHPPTALNLHLWRDAATHALGFWTRLREEERLSASFRRIATECGDAVARAVERRP